MKRVLGLVFLLALVAAPAVAQKVSIDYAHDFDFDSLETFQYVNTEDSNAANQLMDSRIKTAIIRELTEGGLKRVETDPDFLITYHVTTAEKTSYQTTSMGYGGYGGYWGGWYGWGAPGMASTTVSEYNYTEGTLIIDAYDPVEKKMIWRGTGTVTVKASPEKQTKQVDKILKKIGKKWDKILAGKGK